jgi:serine/threonine protein kinase
LPNFKAKINNITDYRNFIINLRKFKAKELSHKYELNRLTNQFKTLSHLNLMLVIDAYLTKDLKSFYILTEFSQNKNNLDTKIRYHRIKQIPIDVNFILKWFYQTLSAMHFLHLNGILHANLKPSNFLLVSGDQIKLTDFGYLNMYFTILNEKSAYITKLAKSNLDYLPKECILSNEYTEYSDMYSVGAVFYELLFLTPYDWSNELLKSNLRIGFRGEENFGRLLASMLSNNETQRPNSLISLDFFNWDGSFRILKTIKDEKGKFYLDYYLF